jgi:hypothetical protein
VRGTIAFAASNPTDVVVVVVMLLRHTPWKLTRAFDIHAPFGPMD